MLTRREHSQRELKQKLVKKGFEKDEIDDVLAEFASNGWQSNQRFAESYARSQIQKGYGPSRIQYELKERGIDASINDVFEQQPDWFDVLMGLHVKKYGSCAPTDMKERAKRTRFLQHKGFTLDMIRKLFNQLP
ncbi:MAG: regulatory protein RecX [Cycloclasticus sp.]|nr:regulatory protein RecX [Cycloclasticus sp.]MBQ0789688.1 regulatory protein RecX [Cycloclasticus sp.]